MRIINDPPMRSHHLAHFNLYQLRPRACHALNACPERVPRGRDPAEVTAKCNHNILNSARPHVSPLEVFTGVKPSLEHFRVFGPRCFVHVDKSKRVKLDAKAHPCLFLGYAEASKAYRVWGYDDKRLVTARTVQLDERAPSPYQDVCYHQVQMMPSCVADDDEDAHERVRQPAEHKMEDTEMEDATVDDEAIDMDVDTPAVHDAIVPTTSESLAVPERGGHSASDPRQVEFRHSDVITDTNRYAALPPATPSCRFQQIVRATRRTMSPSSDQFEPSIGSRMIVTQPGSEAEPENRIVFSGWISSGTASFSYTASTATKLRGRATSSRDPATDQGFTLI
ncbi:unnamed protein product [Phytophthora fragariaefolia]|uniref:Unnamed protein product n=1 Tax=Phytophthora fragariaefolia TaxID=1490495 RepID=A0A9W6WXE9_9STRA|nr:unnamed protein product [Phytophthora fragariaefolia]